MYIMAKATARIGDAEQQQLLVKCTTVFRPAAPLDNRDLFAGRTDQIVQASRAVNAIGQHAIVFGQRGVGKSSLANILRILLSAEDKLVVKVNCHKDDSFATVWKNALADVEMIEERVVGFNKKPSLIPARALDVGQHAGPNEVRRSLQQLGKSIDTVFIFDEFDRLHGSKAQQSFADTIKDLSDNVVNCTLIIVGVANDVSGLIAEHASISRSLVEIHMPRMKTEESKEIVRKAMRELGTSIGDEALDLVVTLSQGLPHYTHLIGQEATMQAIKSNRRQVRLADVREGVNAALQNTQHSILDSYQNATRGQRRGTIFQSVLLGCALAEVDEQGFFVSAAVRDPLSKIAGKPYEIPGFSQHLDKFSTDQARGPVLERAGTPRRYRFRFINPLLQPYVIMRGLSDGHLQGELLDLLKAKKQPSY
jgi:Cdc6-like AAA superfamily ATPase